MAQARHTYEATVQSLQYRIRDEYLGMETAQKLVELYSKVVMPQARLAVESDGSTGGGTMYRSVAATGNYRSGAYSRTTIEQPSFTTTDSDIPEDVVAAYISPNAPNHWGVPALMGRWLIPADPATPTSLPNSSST